MNTFLQNLNERERWMVITAIIAVSFYLFYAILYSPIKNNLNNNFEQLASKSETLTWMKNINIENINKKTQKKVSNNQLLTYIANELKNNQKLKFPYQLQQTTSGEIQLSFEKIPFQYFIIWLNKFSQDYSFTIKQFNAEKTDNSGLTRLLITLNAGV